MSENNNEPKTNELDQYFITLIFSLASAVMQHLGKVANPVTGKVERDIIQAKHTIDMLIMIKQKTQGNLTEKESLTLNNILADLELNYIDELKKEENNEQKH